MNMDQFLMREAKKFREGYKRISRLKKEWNDFMLLAKPFLQNLCQRAEKHGLFERLYVVDYTEYENTRKGLPFITLIWGQHPVGYTGIRDLKLGSEKGCALHFSQNIFGSVACIFYPFSSDFHQRREKYILYKVYKNPVRINLHELTICVKYMFSYAQNTSFVGSPDFNDKLKVRYLEFMSLIKSLEYSKYLKPTLSIVKEIIALKLAGSIR